MSKKEYAIKVNPYAQIVFLMALLFFSYYFPKGFFAEPCASNFSHPECDFSSLLQLRLAQAFSAITSFGSLVFSIVIMKNLLTLKKSKPGSRVILEEDYLLGPVKNFWRTAEKPVFYNKIKQINLFRRDKQSFYHTLEVISPNNTISVHQGQIENKSLLELIENLKEKTPHLDHSQLDRKTVDKVFLKGSDTNRSMSHNMIFLLLLVILGIFIYFTRGRFDLQIDRTTILSYSIWASIFLSFVLIFIFSKFRKPKSAGRHLFFVFTFFTLNFIAGIFATRGVIARINQDWDQSPAKATTTQLIFDEIRSKEYYKYKGNCYYLATFPDESDSFGSDQICDKRYKNLEPNKEVSIMVKRGFFGYRWASEINLELKERYK